ncbi:hypothetical protein M422DRAFT_781425 [Sphaerobolus stellatus SS14]|uniref:Glycerol-1-phosphatase n=1 Tax=Sphaerobolus stellatus (strain SS14) TaxID=990650 RepID=A0A0C9U685_SPHS4|nr:hypothetical protein M422DRAFT_781425 [Sphaerobolus stellatus SS14]
MPTITVDAILFDMDGTLIDSTPGVIKAWRTFGKEYGFDPEAAIVATHGVRLWDSMKIWCNIDDDVKLKAEAMRFEEVVIEGGPIALPGVLTLLDQIRTGSTASTPGWTVVTSATSFYAPKALVSAGVEVSPYVPITTANDVTRGKPYPDPFATGAKSLNVDPKNCLVVEDAVSGILSGKAAGARVLGVCTSSEREVVATAKPDWIVPDLTHVSVKWVDGKVEVTINDA